MKIYSKLKRLFEAVAARGGELTSQKALAAAMGVSAPLVTQMFGHGRENDPLDQPPHQLGKLLQVFGAAGIRVERHWLDVPLEEFDRLLRESTGFDARRLLNWTDVLRLHARHYDGLRLRRLAGLRLRRDGARPAPALDRFRIDERVYLALEVPEAFLEGEGQVFATVVHEAWHKTTCLFPLAATDGLVAGEELRLPRPREEFYTVEGPTGVQRVHTILSRFRPAASVHEELEDIDLHLGLDRLASELSKRQAADWRLLSMAFEVTEAVSAGGAVEAPHG